MGVWKHVALQRKQRSSKEEFEDYIQVTLSPVMDKSPGDHQRVHLTDFSQMCKYNQLGFAYSHQPTSSNTCTDVWRIHKVPRTEKR